MLKGKSCASAFVINYSNVISKSQIEDTFSCRMMNLN